MCRRGMTGTGQRQRRAGLLCGLSACQQSASRCGGRSELAGCGSLPTWCKAYFLKGLAALALVLLGLCDLLGVLGLGGFFALGTLFAAWVCASDQSLTQASLRRRLGAECRPSLQGTRRVLYVCWPSAGRALAITDNTCRCAAPLSIMLEDIAA